MWRQKAGQNIRIIVIFAFATKICKCSNLVNMSKDYFHKIILPPYTTLSLTSAFKLCWLVSILKTRKIKSILNRNQKAPNFKQNITERCDTNHSAKYWCNVCQQFKCVRIYRENSLQNNKFKVHYNTRIVFIW